MMFEIPAGTIRARSLIAGFPLPGDWMPAGVYEILRAPNGIPRCLIPAGQGRLHEGTFYYPLDWSQVWAYSDGSRAGRWWGWRLLALLSPWRKSIGNKPSVVTTKGASDAWSSD